MVYLLWCQSNAIYFTVKRQSRPSGETALIKVKRVTKEHPRVKNILVAIDDIEATTISTPIMKQTQELASVFSSKVWILHVIPRLGEAPFNVDGEILRQEVDTERRREHRCLQHLVQSLRDCNIDATALLLEGKVITTILEQSNRLDIELIVLGCHKHGLLYGALMNITDDGLLSKCCRPIMIIPLPA